MDKITLAKSKNKFIKIEITSEERYCFDNFNNLMEYIGKCNVINVNRDAMGNAYLKIIERTNQILGVSKYHLRNRILLTKKSEIKSIRKCFFAFDKSEGLKKIYYIKIPFKILTIFEAIVDIVEETKIKNSMPKQLEPLINFTYGLAFYNKHMIKYDMKYNYFRERARRGDINPIVLELHNDFHSNESSFKRVFK